MPLRLPVPPPSSLSGLPLPRSSSTSLLSSIPHPDRYFISFQRDLSIYIFPCTEVSGPQEHNILSILATSQVHLAAVWHSALRQVNLEWADICKAGGQKGRSLVLVQFVCVRGTSLLCFLMCAGGNMHSTASSLISLCTCLAQESCMIGSV